MSQEEELLGKFENMQHTVKELLILAENLDNNYQKLLRDLALTEKQINKFVDDPANFTQEEWSELESEKEQMQKMLEMQMAQIQDPRKVQKKYSQRKRVKNNWLFVR